MRVIVPDHTGKFFEARSPGPGFYVQFRVADMEIRVESREGLAPGERSEDAIRAIREQLKRAL
jgi:hypothetical protein